MANDFGAFASSSEEDEAPAKVEPVKQPSPVE